MSIVNEIEILRSPSPMIDRDVAVLFGQASPRKSISCRCALGRTCRCIGGHSSGNGGFVKPFTASFDAVKSLVVGGTIIGNAQWTSTLEGDPIVIANFRGKPGRGHNLACAMLAAVIRFYMPELDDTHASDS